MNFNHLFISILFVAGHTRCAYIQDKVFIYTNDILNKIRTGKGQPAINGDLFVKLAGGSSQATANALRALNGYMYKPDQEAVTALSALQAGGSLQITPRLAKKYVVMAILGALGGDKNLIMDQQHTMNPQKDFVRSLAEYLAAATRLDSDAITIYRSHRLVGGPEVGQHFGGYALLTGYIYSGGSTKVQAIFMGKERLGPFFDAERQDHLTVATAPELLVLQEAMPLVIQLLAASRYGLTLHFYTPPGSDAFVPFQTLESILDLTTKHKPAHVVIALKEACTFCWTYKKNLHDPIVLLRYGAALENLAKDAAEKAAATAAAAAKAQAQAAVKVISTATPKDTSAVVQVAPYQLQSEAVAIAKVQEKVLDFLAAPLKDPFTIFRCDCHYHTYKTYALIVGQMKMAEAGLSSLIYSLHRQGGETVVVANIGLLEKHQKAGLTPLALAETFIKAFPGFTSIARSIHSKVSCTVTISMKILTLKQLGTAIEQTRRKFDLANP